MITAASSIPAERLPARLRHFLWQHPTWWTYALFTLAWLTLAIETAQNPASAHGRGLTVASELSHWLLMVFAMMTPLIQNELRAIAFASLWQRRQWGAILGLFGYSAVWLMAGVPVVVLAYSAPLPPILAPALAFFAAAVWQLVPLRGYALAACHRSCFPAPFSPRFEWDALMHGAKVGVGCVGACWPLMAACTLANHSVLAMLCCLGLGIAERRSFRPRTKVVAAGALVLGFYFLFRYGTEQVGLEFGPVLEH